MARQPRFIEDDEPVATPKRGRQTTREFIEDEGEPKRAIPDADDAPEVAPAPETDDVPETPAEADAEEAAATPSRMIPQDDDSDNGSGSGRTKLLIVALLLLFAIVGAGVYALVHFVVFGGGKDTNTVEATERPAPTVQQDPTLTPIPTQPPTQAPTEPDYAALADAYMAGMSDYEKLCQLFIVTPEVLTAAQDNSDGAVTMAGAMTEQSLQDYPVGGVIYFSDNLEDIDQTMEMIENTKSYSKTPLFIAVDEEGGDVARVADKLGTTKYKPMLSYKDQGEQTAHDNAETIASNIRALGFNMDNAPVADVLSNPDNTVIGDRAYSDDFAQAAQLVSAAVSGFSDGGVVTVLKHFPGHGSTDEDSHYGYAYVDTSVDDLLENEMQPFRAGIEAGADMVMVGHLIVNDVDPDMPASLSSKVVPELLRNKLGYQGIVISDSMMMGAITYDYYTTVMGLFAADVDVILQPDNLDRYIETIQSCLESGEITQEQIDAKVKKILTLKFKRGIMKPADENQNATPAAAITPAQTPATSAAPTTPVNAQTPALPETPASTEESDATTVTFIPAA